MNKRLIFASGMIIIAVIGLFIAISYFTSLQKVTLIYDPSHGNVHLTGDRLNGKLDVAPNKEMSLQKGVYQIHITGANAQPDTRALIVQEDPITQTVPISLPAKTLETQLEKDRQAILEILHKDFPAISLYTINPGKLYDRGDWYATTLTYIGSDRNNRDTLRLVMQKQSGMWKLITKLPQPLLSAVEYPQVPKAVLDDINKPVYLPGTDISPAIYPN